MKKMILVVAVVFMMASSAYAKNVSQNCGCGLGHELIGQKEGLVWNLLGTFLNGICGNQTFGMTTGTLGCDTGGKLVMNERMEIFVAENRDGLAQVIAPGNAETLSALAEIAQVSSDNQTRMFSMLQSNFDTIYPDANVSDKHVVTVINDIMASI